MSSTLILAIGKKTSPAILEMESLYLNRLSHYGDFKLVLIPDSKQKKKEERLKEEGTHLKKHLTSVDRLILLDERGKSFSSPALAEQIQKDYARSLRKIAYVIGGAYGVDPEISRSAHLLLSLSALTLPHELARVVLLEQLYRAHTILKGEKYHHG